MAQSGYTPISLYYSTTAAATPTAGNLVNGELAINITDGKLYYKDNGGVVKLLAGSTSGPAGGSNTQVQFNSSGVLSGSSSLTWDGTYLTAGSIKDSALTSGRITFAGASGLLSDSASLTWDGTTLVATKFSGALNGTVGATTPNTGAFTTLSASSTATLSGLTASTALALDASKNIVSVTNTGSGNNVLATSPTITGATLTTSAFNGTVGATTPSTGAFTTLSSTGAYTASANIGITRTPLSNTASVFKTLEIGAAGTGTSTFFGQTNASAGGISTNTIFDASNNYVYATSAAVSNLYMYNGSTKVQYAASGTAGNTFTPTTIADFTSTGLAVTGTLSATGDLTLSGGTANGVGYLNGSKVLTTGSALTWNGSTLLVGGNTRFGSGAVIPGFATASDASLANNASIRGTNAAGSTAFELIKLNTSDQVVINNDGADAVLTTAATSVRWTIGTEQMRLTSTGLGIGNTSQSSFINGQRNLVIGSGSSISGMTVYTGSTNSATIAFADGLTGDQQYRGYVQYDHSADALLLGTAANTRVTLDSPGNLGLGVTPSAWTVGKAVEVGYLGNAFWGNSSTATYLTTNAYYAGGWKYGATGAASNYQQSAGVHSWSTAPSGTAGNAITFTQAMDLANSSGASTLTVNSAINTASTIRLTTNGGLTAGMFLANPTVDHSLGFQTAGSERARIPAAGGFQCVNSISVGNATPTTSGAGITFPATQSASSDANTLDDYEEGTWTPNQGSGLTVVGAFSSIGRYTKIGNSVTVWGQVTGATSIAVASASFITTNLPFPVNNDLGINGIATGYWTANSAAVHISIGSANSVYAAQAISGSTDIGFTITYRV